MAVEQQDAPLSYDGVGFTGRGLSVASPLGATGSIVVGRGEAVQAQSVRALFGRSMFRRDGVALPTSMRVSESQVFAYGTRYAGLWTLHTCRVVYVQQPEPGAHNRTWSFAHGTLPIHGVRGEECFELRVDADSGEVVFTIVQASWPANGWIRASTPLVRGVQKRFIEQSLSAFKAAVDGGVSAV